MTLHAAMTNFSPLLWNLLSKEQADILHSLSPSFVDNLIIQEPEIVGKSLSVYPPLPPILSCYCFTVLICIS